MNKQRHQLTHIVPILLLAALPDLSIQASVQQSQGLSLLSRIALINIKGRIDHFSVDVTGQRLFVAAVENHTLEIVDLKSGQHVHTISDLAEPQGVLYDPATNHLFVACGLDGVTKVLDGTAFQVLATAEIAGKTDDLFYDSVRRRVYVLMSVGYLEVFEQKDANHYARIARYQTPLGSQTGLFVPEWGKLFVAVRAQSGQSAKVRIYEAH